MGKGCKQRPCQISAELEEARWNLAFAKTDQDRKRWKKRVIALEKSQSVEPVTAEEFTGILAEHI